MKIQDLNLAGLKYFLDAVELKSVTLSAQKNNVSRSAISQSIRRLEHWCGYDLLTHDKRVFILTENGATFYKSAKLNYESFENGFVQKTNAEEILKIGCSASLVDIVFPIFSSGLDKINSPTIKIGTSQHLLSLLDNEEINLAFLIDTSKSRHHNYAEIYSDDFELRSKSGSLGNTLITTENRPEVESLFLFANKKKIKFKNHIVVESWTNSNRLAEIIESVCLVPAHLPKGKLKSISLKGWKHSYKAYAVSRKRSLLSSLEAKILLQLSKK